MNILIKGAHVVDPGIRRDEVCDILVQGSQISEISKKITHVGANAIEAKGKIVMPGLVDMHTHLREPGREDKETVASATSAALKGGITSVLAMPNTSPAIDSEKTLGYLQKVIKKSALCNVLVCGAITKGRYGRSLVDIASLTKGGIVAISDDGASVDDDKLMLKALKCAKQNKLLVICHSEDKSLSKDGVVNLGIVSTRMGVRGVSRESEYRRIERDIKLAKEAHSAVHIAHVSCSESVEIIADAKKKGIKVTAETAPHYFSLTEEDVLNFDTNMKMNPPLRRKEDLKAIRAGLGDGTIDVIASDHAPHTENEKDIEFDHAEFGVIGLETELSLCITELVGSGILTWMGLAEKLALNPAKILGIKRGTLEVGAVADLVIVSPDKEWVVKKQDFLSKSKNSAFIGRKLKGVVEYTLCNGKIAFKR